MNDMAISMKKEDLTGCNVMKCHNSHSQEIILRMLEHGGQYVYTIEKNDVRKLLYQSSWLNDDGTIGGLCEIMVLLDGEIPHFTCNKVR